ncbi:transposase [Capnocytophaga sp. oral taxon 338 str. F0234]|nr:transposase [Capnocytophaga sp. oral taxon 338 str. F0234]
MNIRKRRCTTSLPYLWNYPFTSGNNGRLGVPEYVLDKRVSPKIGAEIWRIKPDGTEELIGVFKEENNIERFYKIK